MRSSRQSILRTVEVIGRKDAIDLYNLALPILETSLKNMQSFTSSEHFITEARQLISSVLIYGSEDLQQLLNGLLNNNYPDLQRSQVINSIRCELRISITEVRYWLMKDSSYSKELIVGK